MLKKSILFAAFAIALLTLSTFSSAKAEILTYRLDLYKENKLIYQAFFTYLPDCLVTGMAYKKQGHTFVCELVRVGRKV